MENTVTTKKVKIKRPQTVGEEIANAVSHGVVALFGVYVLVALIVKSTTGLKLFAAILYGVAFITLFLMSCLYHSLSFTGSRGVFKRFDHISIFLLIGGTFAPFLLLLDGLRTPFLGISWLLDTGWMMFIIQWFFIILGVIFKAIWVNKFQSFHYLIYIVLGWSALTFISVLINFSVPAFWLVLGGGIAYTVGTVFYALSRIKYFHFVWHIFVALGAILQFIAIILYLY